MVMVWFRVGLDIIKIYFNATWLLQWSFPCIFQSIAFMYFYIRYKMGRLRFGDRLGGQKF